MLIATPEAIREAVAQADIEMARAGIVTGGRWTPKRKEALIRVMDDYPLARVELMKRFILTTEEVDGWRRGLRTMGAGGLLVSNIRSIDARRNQTA